MLVRLSGHLGLSRKVEDISQYMREFSTDVDKCVDKGVDN